jgi:hypothetical protein
LLDDEFDRACAYVLDGPCSRHSRFTHLLAEGFSHARGRRLFQHLLVAPLHRAVTLEQIDVVALAVAKHLDLDVARALHILLNQHCVVTKAVDGLTLA